MQEFLLRFLWFVKLDLRSKKKRRRESAKRFLKSSMAIEICNSMRPYRRRLYSLADVYRNRIAIAKEIKDYLKYA